MDLKESKLVFHGRVGPRRTCRLSTDIFVVVYIYIYSAAQLTFVLQVAVCLILCCVVSLFVSAFKLKMN